MTDKVYAISLRTHYKENILDKLKRLWSKLEPEKEIKKNSLSAVKIHFGELGTHAFIRPNLVRVFTQALKELESKPFLTDTNTLYAGGRTNSVDHLETAIKNGFDYSVVGAPLIIADGLKGENYTEVEIKQENFKYAYIANDIINADNIIALTHFKGHEMSGFGGSLKNLAMGAAARRGKLAQHSTVNPKVKNKLCIGCQACLKLCAHGALSIAENKKAFIEPKKCVGCAACIPVCPKSAIQIQYDANIPIFLKKMMEYALAAVQGKKDKCFYINFLTNISPICDCANHSDAPIVADIGILASRNPVALDQACADLVNQAQGLPNTALSTKALAPNTDKWTDMHPNCHWQLQLEYAEKIGLGSRKYNLIWLKEAFTEKKEEASHL